MKIGEITTGHDPLSEKKFASTLFIALLIAIIIIAFFSIAVGRKVSLNPLSPGSRMETSEKSTAPGR